MTDAISSILVGTAMFIGVIAMAAYVRMVEPNNVTLEYLMIGQVCLIGSLGLCIASDGCKQFRSIWAAKNDKRRARARRV